MDRKLVSGQDREIQHPATFVDKSGSGSCDVEEGPETAMLAWLAIVAIAGLGLLATVVN